MEGFCATQEHPQKFPEGNCTKGNVMEISISIRGLSTRSYMSSQGQ